MKKILLADKVDPEISSLEALLKKEGLKVSTAGTAEEALSLARQERMDMIIADLDLEEMGGDGLSTMLGESEDLRKGLYIVLICNGKKAELERCGRCGANTYVKRPVDIKALYARVDALVSGKLTRATRVLVKVDVKSLYHNESFFCTSKNLSVTGILLESDRILAKGDEISLSFFLPDEDRISSVGKVMRVARGNESKYVYGVEFFQIEDESRTVIGQFIDRQKRDGNFY